MRIHPMNINFFQEKSFHWNFWPKFDLWNGVNMRQFYHLPTLSVKKNFETFFKNPLPQFCRAWSGEQITVSTHNMVLSLELKAKKILGEQFQKNAFECPFEIIGFTCCLNSKKSWFSKTSPKTSSKTYLHHPHMTNIPEVS